MGANDHRDWRVRTDRRVAASSAVLLSVFVAAAALMIALVVLRPGIGGDAGVPSIPAGPAAAQSGAPPAGAATLGAAPAPTQRLATPADSAGP